MLSGPGLKAEASESVQSDQAARRSRAHHRPPGLVPLPLPSRRYSTVLPSPSRYGKRYEVHLYNARVDQVSRGIRRYEGYTYRVDLFDESGLKNLAGRAPLAERLRPATLDEVVGQPHLTDEGGPLRSVVERGRIGSIVLWGPPGTGKTTLARVLANTVEEEFVPLSAVTSGVKDLRAALDGARERLKYEGRGTLVFVDEVHRFNKNQQDALLPALEEGLVDFIGATTENPSFEVTAPLLSRSRVLRLRISHGRGPRPPARQGRRGAWDRGLRRSARVPLAARRRRRTADAQRPGGCVRRHQAGRGR